MLFSHWESVDYEERKRGAPMGKPREKILSFDEMATILEK